MSTHEKPRPTLAVLQWLDAHGVDAESAVNDYQSFENANVLGNRIGHAVWLTETLAGNLARGTVGRRQSVDLLRELHKALFDLGRDLSPEFPPQSMERSRWGHVANGLVEWMPSAVNSENTTRY